MRNSIYSIKLLLLLAVALCAFGCAADVATDENTASIEHALACAYPHGSVGDASVPATGKVTTFGAWGAQKMIVTFTPDSAAAYSGLLTWDRASAASISDSWTGTQITTVEFRLAGFDVFIDINAGLPDAASIKFAGSTGSPSGASITMNGGVTRIEATNNSTGNYRALKFTGWHNGAIVTATRTIISSGGC